MFVGHALLLSVDGLSASSIAVGEVPSLAHEAGDHMVEGAALVAKTLLTSAECTKFSEMTKKRRGLGQIQ